MSDSKPEALRLADAVEISSNHGMRREAAAELRRLHASCEDYAQHKQRQDQRILKLYAQRDALLEALKAAEPYLRHADVAYNVYVQARAAIKTVENV